MFVWEQEPKPSRTARVRRVAATTRRIHREYVRLTLHVTRTSRSLIRLEVSFPSLVIRDRLPHL
jgi:hypothetical protein